MDLVVGMDGGGTTLRVAIADLEGNQLAEATGPGINPNSGGDPGRSFDETLGWALAAAPTGRIVGGVAGLAGFITNGPALTRALESAWRRHGLTSPVRAVSDLVVAFWSGEARPAGTVLIAGTGAIAGLVSGAELGATSDGYGYLLGDRGGGVWLGRAAVRAALDGHSGRGPATLLTKLVLRDETACELIASVYAASPKELGKYARFVDQAYHLGDPVAAEIVDEAVSELVRTVESLPGADGGPLVLVGSVATGDHPVAAGLRSRLQELGWTVSEGNSGLTGALRLARHQVLAVD
ncbi:N-acetylglucosamine kinase [Scrofimicrobium sp. R131]|uniref:ATPase BadF/BadG/BcrA/BcrD type domain-containing protein n=1 Tax=Scrofimicrobium appendicitidis TaxID=3079930 RepID=A0AAU7V974_9ACTO